MTTPTDAAPAAEAQQIPPETMRYTEAYDTLNAVAEKLNKLDGRDLDQVLPLLETAEKAHAVVQDRVLSILSSPLLTTKKPEPQEISA